MRDISLSTHNVVSPEVVAAELVVDEHQRGVVARSVLLEQDVAALDVVVAEHDRGVDAGKELAANKQSHIAESALLKVLTLATGAPPGSQS